MNSASVTCVDSDVRPVIETNKRLKPAMCDRIRAESEPSSVAAIVRARHESGEGGQGRVQLSI